MSVFSGLVLPNSWCLAGCFLVWLFAWKHFGIFGIFQAPPFSCSQKLGQGGDWLTCFKKILFCVRFCFRVSPSVKALFWEGASYSLHGKLFTPQLWEGTVCTCPFTNCLVKPLRISVLHAYETYLCRDCAWQLCRTTEHTNIGFCCVLALTAQCLSSVCSSFGRKLGT